MSFALSSLGSAGLINSLVGVQTAVTREAKLQKIKNLLSQTIKAFSRLEVEVERTPENRKIADEAYQRLLKSVGKASKKVKVNSVSKHALESLLHDHGDEPVVLAQKLEEILKQLSSEARSVNSKIDSYILFRVSARKASSFLRQLASFANFEAKMKSKDQIGAELSKLEVLYQRVRSRLTRDGLGRQEMAMVVTIMDKSMDIARKNPSQLNVIGLMDASATLKDLARSKTSSSREKDIKHLSKIKALVANRDNLVSSGQLKKRANVPVATKTPYTSKIFSAAFEAFKVVHTRAIDLVRKMSKSKPGAFLK